MSVTELMVTLGPQGITREQLVATLRQLTDMVSFDERTGIVRPRKAGAGVAAEADAAMVEAA